MFIFIILRDNVIKAPLKVLFVCFNSEKDIVESMSILDFGYSTDLFDLALRLIGGSLEAFFAINIKVLYHNKGQSKN